jgi:transposase InsO family protein
VLEAVFALLEPVSPSRIIFIGSHSLPPPLWFVVSVLRGFPRLSLEKELVYALCRHAKMVATSHPPLTDVMTERPCELLHMDIVGLAPVRSAGGKWYVLVVVDDYSRYAWVFFLEEKGKTFGFVRDLVLRLRNETHGDAI